MKKLKHKNIRSGIKRYGGLGRFLFLLSSMLFLLGTSSCLDEDLINKDSLADSESVRVKARIMAQENTRSEGIYYGKEEVYRLNEGTFYLTYPNKDNRYETATVEFGKGEDFTTGYAYVEDGGVIKDLKWKKVYNEGRNNVSLFLHNIRPEHYTLSYPNNNTSTNQKYLLKTDSPYFASPLDTVHGTNDLIISGGETQNTGGATSANANSGNVIFNLYHRMSLLKINIEVYSAEDGYLVDLSNAKIKITNLYTRLSGINLYYCTDSNFSSSNSSNSTNYYTEPKDVYLIGSEDGNGGNEWMRFLNGSTGELQPYYDKPYTPNDFDGTYTKRTYSVPDFIFPPQTFRDGYQPELLVTVPKKDVTGIKDDEGEVTFHGYLPPIMYDSDENGKIAPDTPPMATKLNSGYELHVTATINSPDTELIFAPVKVENWVSKSHHLITTKKAGIYNHNDFLELIKNYNDKNISELEKFGFKSGDTYIFQMWGHFTLNEDEVSNQMPENPDIPFVFIINDYTIGIESGSSKENLVGIAGQERLYEIVTGKHPEIYKGLRNGEDLKELFSHCHASDNYEAPEVMDLLKFGNLSTYDNSWTFYLENDVTINVEDLFQTIDADFLLNTYDFNYQGHTLNIKFGEEIMESKAGDEYDKLRKLAEIREYGVKDALDFYFLIECYNGYCKEFPDVLSLFAKKSSETSWALYFPRAMTLDADRVFTSMVPDPENGKPNLTNGTPWVNYFLNFSGPGYYFSWAAGVTNIPYIFNGKGKANGISSLSSIISYYNASTSIFQNLILYGRVENGKWIFPLNYSNSQSIAYSSAFGRMIPDPENGKLDYEFEFDDKYYQVTGMPDAPDSSDTSTHYFYQDGTDTYDYPNSAADLKKITLGTYWDEWP